MDIKSHLREFVVESLCFTMVLPPRLPAFSTGMATATQQPHTKIEKVNTLSSFLCQKLNLQHIKRALEGQYHCE